MRNALFGYTYQNHVALLFLSKMDVERDITKIECEIKSDSNFDDLYLKINNESYFLQIKDYNTFDITDIQIIKEGVKIKKSEYKTKRQKNVIVAKHIALNPNSNFLGIPSYNMSGLEILSLSRSQIDNQIDQLYSQFPSRKGIIEKFLNTNLDNRKLDIDISDLPPINVFNTDLSEASLILSEETFDFDNLLHIIGKPGVGKSHYVKLLEKLYPNNLIYRFWISNQDKDYKNRLSYFNFLQDISFKVFRNLIPRSESEIIKGIRELGNTFIIDGLDHVENYNNSELSKFIDFINVLAEHCKTIVLSRPLSQSTSWHTAELSNWNLNQTERILEELYHIQDYTTKRNIYEITSGYPLLVRYISEYFKRYKTLPTTQILDSVNDYYSSILSLPKTKKALRVFLCTSSFLMRSDLNFLFDNTLSEIVLEYVDQHPYLFEIKLNRISLFHDSLNNYLHIENVNSKELNLNTNIKIVNSIMLGQKRFMTRVNSFDLNKVQIRKIFSKYSSLKVFENLIIDVVDFEAIEEFYLNLRMLLSRIDPQDISLNSYYDFSLILNLINKGHVNDNLEFQYWLAKYLILSEFEVDQITSSGYLFGMLHFLKSGDNAVLGKLNSENYRGHNFNDDFTHNVINCTDFFTPKNKLTDQVIDKALDKGFEFQYLLPKILVSIYTNKTTLAKHAYLNKAINQYIHSDKDSAVRLLYDNITIADMNETQLKWKLEEAMGKIFSLGFAESINPYKRYTLEQLINRNFNHGSFTLWPKILNYLRLATFEKRKIDLKSLSNFWTKYYQRKDYSLLSIDKPLFRFSKFNLISIKECIILIQSIRDQSEKSYYNLLTDYIELFNPKKINELIEEYDLFNESIYWFSMDSKIINELSTINFNRAFNIFLEQNNYGSSISNYSLKNIANSKYKNDFFTKISEFGFSVRLESKDSEILELCDKYEIKYEKSNSYREKESKPNKALENYARGVLRNEDIQFVKENKLTIIDVAKCGDGWYQTLNNLDLFEAFPTEEIRKSIPNILHVALSSKNKIFEAFNNIDLLPGNILELIFKYEKNTNTIRFFESFCTYIKLSKFEIKGSI